VVDGRFYYSTGLNALRLRAGGSWTTLASGAGYSDEQAQDAINTMLAAGTHTGGLGFTYDDTGGDQNLRWQWSDDVEWEPQVQMTMDSEVANKYFQGKENIPIAIARRRIKSSGDMKAALKLIPITKPVFAQYRELLEREYPHLVV